MSSHPPNGAASSPPPGSQPPRSRGRRSRLAGIPWGLGSAVLVLLTGTAAGIVLALPVFQVFGDPLAEGGTGLGLLILVQPVAYVLAVLVVVGVAQPSALRWLAGVRRPRVRDAVGGAALGVGGFVIANIAVATAVVWVLERAGREVPPTQETFQAAAADVDALPFLLVGAVLLAPIAEELVFRGVVYPALARRLPRSAAMWLSAVVFAVVHAAGPETVGNVVVVAVILPFGALLAWGYERSGTLLVPIVAHVVFNAISVSQLVAVVG